MSESNKNTAVQAKKPTFAGTIQLPVYQKMIASTIQNSARRDRFQAAIISAVAVNPDLQECDVGSILAGALLGESLGLSPSPQLGHYYLVPYAKKAAFQIGYKGMIQMSVKSGMYKKIIVTPVKTGEFVKYNRMTEEIVLNPIEDDALWEATETIGYYAKIELISGFVKEIYRSKENVEAHGRRYSKAYNKFWGKNFDAMAMKTVLRQLLGTWGVQSSEMASAVEAEEIYGTDYDGEMPKIELARGSDDNVEFVKDEPGDKNEGGSQPKPDAQSEETPIDFNDL